MYEGQRDTLYNQQFNMEQTRFTVESIQDTVQTVQALKGASKQMKTAMKTNKELDLNFIDRLQDDLADMAVSHHADRLLSLLVVLLHVQHVSACHTTTYTTAYTVHGSALTRP